MNISESRDIQAKMPSPVSSVFIITEPFFPHYYIIHLCKKIVTVHSVLSNTPCRISPVNSNKGFHKNNFM